MSEQEKVRLYLSIENAKKINTCPYAHGREGLTCQCRYDFGHTGNCKCFDETCKLEWERS